MQSALPVIGYYTKSMEEYCGEAAILLQEKNFELLGEALIRLYKDETLSAAMCNFAKKRAEALSRRQACEKLFRYL